MDFELPIDLSVLDRYGNTAKILTLMEPHVRKAMGTIRDAVRERTPTGATGRLRKSIAVMYDTKEGVGRVYVPPGLKAGMYADSVEYGRLAGKYPPWKTGTALYDWVTRTVTTAAYKKTGKVQRKTKAREKMILQISFLIARSIARKGTYRSDKTPDGSPHMFELGFQDSKDMAIEIIEDGIAQVMKELGE